VRSTLFTLTSNVALPHRYSTWNEVFLFDDITIAAVAPNVASLSYGADPSNGGVCKSSSHVYLGQLPTVEHMQILKNELNVTCVVSCVEEFELKQYDLNFSAMGFEHCILPQVRSAALMSCLA